MGRLERVAAGEEARRKREDEDEDEDEGGRLGKKESVRLRSDCEEYFGL